MSYTPLFVELTGNFSHKRAVVCLVFSLVNISRHMHLRTGTKRDVQAIPLSLAKSVATSYCVPITHSFPLPLSHTPDILCALDTGRPTLGCGGDQYKEGPASSSFLCSEPVQPTQAHPAFPPTPRQELRCEPEYWLLSAC